MLGEPTDGIRCRIDIGTAILALAAGPNRTLAAVTEDGIVSVRLLNALDFKQAMPFRVHHGG